VTVDCCSNGHLGKARFFRRNVTPFLDNRLLDLPGVGSGSGAHLLGDINTLLSWLQLGNQFRHVLAGSLGLQIALLHWGILDYGLNLVIADFGSLFETTASGSTQFSGFLGTACDGSVLLDILLIYGTHLPGPLGALGAGRVPARLVLALLLGNSLTLDNIIYDIMLLLFGPAL